MSTIIKAAGSMTAPISGTPIAQGARTAITSDSFNRANTGDIVGSYTDAELGGRPMRWEGQVGGIGIANNRAVRGTGSGTFVAGVFVPNPDVDVLVLVSAALTAGNLYLDVRRQNVNANESPDGYRLQFFSSAVTVTKRAASGGAQLIAPVPYKVGDLLRVTVKGSNIALAINNVVVGEAVDSTIPSAGYVGLAGTTEAAGFAFDHIAIHAA